MTAVISVGLLLLSSMAACNQADVGPGAGLQEDFGQNTVQETPVEEEAMPAEEEYEVEPPIYQRPGMESEGRPPGMETENR